MKKHINWEDIYTRLSPKMLRISRRYVKSIVKKVRAIAPVRYYYNETDINDEKLQKRIVFEVRINE